MIVDAIKGRLTWDKALLAVQLILVLGSAMGLFLYGVAWAFATTVSDEGLHGPNMCGLRRTIGWDDIGTVRQVVVKGIPYLLIRSRSSKKQIWLCILGFKEPTVLERLQTPITTAGAGTPATSSEEKSA
jgi:hypothetical protein